MIDIFTRDGLSAYSLDFTPGSIAAWTDPFTDAARANQRAEELRREREAATEETIARNARIKTREAKKPEPKGYPWPKHFFKL